MTAVGRLRPANRLKAARRLALLSFLLATATTAGHLPARAGIEADVAGAAVQTVAADSGSPEAGGAGMATQLDATDAYRLALLRMKANLSVARALLQMHNPDADYYLREPLEIIFRNTQAELERRDAPFTADFLEQLSAVSVDDPPVALATIESAVTAIDGSFAQTGGMDSRSVLALSEALLREAVARYGEAVVDNEVVDLPKYQTGRGYVTEAEALVRYAGALGGRPGYEELVRAVTLVRQAWPGIVPPPIVFDPASVDGWFEEAVAAMDRLR